MYGPCFVIHPSFAIVLMGKRELIALLLLSTRCLSVAIPHGAVG